MNTNESPLVVVVSHSHWDREWYLPFEVFRHRLVRMATSLMELLEGKEEYRHFMMDGQTVLLEDIVELRPDLEERMSGHIRAGRISIGPWYVLQDEFLVGGESVARNMLLGQQVGRRFGTPMQVGYIPDASARALSSRRTRTIVRPRQIAMYLAKVMTPRSLPEIGRRFGNRDHTTVLHAVRKIEEMARADYALAQELELLKRMLDA